MKKTLRLFLSAVLASSGLLAVAAPLAPDGPVYPNRPSDMSIEDPLQDPVYTVPLKRFINAAADANSGIIREISPLEEANFRALRSATAARRALSDMVDIVGQVAASGSTTKAKVNNFYYLPHTSTGTFRLYGKAASLTYN